MNIMVFPCNGKSLNIFLHDRFWVTVAYPLSPVKLIASNNPADGTNPLQSVEGTFQLTAADIDLLQNMEYDVQAWCILLNDKVPFRMQWPLYADLKVNGVPVKTMSRPGSHLLGANGRDDGPMIAFYIGEEINRISLSGCDARSFCLGVRLVKRRTIEQILNLILDEQNAEPLEDALVRVRCCIGGGMATAYEDSDSDSDLEVIADCVTVNLRCPMSGSRIKTAG
ncbi:SUMO ligase siz1, partial [Sarracenia purpurea var. burkii]